MASGRAYSWWVWLIRTILMHPDLFVPIYIKLLLVVTENTSNTPYHHPQLPQIIPPYKSSHSVNYFLFFKKSHHPITLIFIIPMSHQQKPQGTISNLRLSSEVINLSPETQTGELIITNTHTHHSLLFKIKTRIEKVLEVRPSRGLLKPGEKAVVNFKSINPLNEQDRLKYEKTLQFLLQGVNVNKQQMTKQQEQALWKAIKQKKADISLGYCAVKIGINMSGGAEQRQFVPSLANYESRLDNKFSSNIKSEKSASSLKDANRFPSEHRDSTKSDTELSQRYAQLKSQHDQLEREREKLFAVKTPGGKSSSKKTIMLAIIFVVFFLLGNYLRGVMEPPPKPVQTEKGWLESLFG